MAEQREEDHSEGRWRDDLEGNVGNLGLFSVRQEIFAVSFVEKLCAFCIFFQYLKMFFFKVVI